MKPPRQQLTIYDALNTMQPESCLNCKHHNQALKACEVPAEIDPLDTVGNLIIDHFDPDDDVNPVELAALCNCYERRSPDPSAETMSLFLEDWRITIAAKVMQTQHYTYGYWTYETVHVAVGDLSREMAINEALKAAEIEQSKRKADYPGITFEVISTEVKSVEKVAPERIGFEPQSYNVGMSDIPDRELFGHKIYLDPDPLLTDTYISIYIETPDGLWFVDELLESTVEGVSQMCQRKDTRWHLWQAEQWIHDRIAGNGQIPLSLMP